MVGEGADGADLEGTAVIPGAAVGHFLFGSLLVAVIPIVRSQKIQRIADQPDIHIPGGFIFRQCNCFRVQVRLAIEMFRCRKWLDTCWD
jgi:hypothetical protein